MTIYTPSVGTIWRTIEAYGHDPRRVISEHEYSPGAPGSGDARLPYETLARLRARALELIGDPAVGLRAADQIHPSHLGPLGYAWLASSTLLDGFRRLERYGRMLNEREELLVEEGPEQLTVTVKVPAEIEYIDQIRDAILAILVALCRLNYGEGLNPDLVRLIRHQPGDPGPWFSFFRCPIEFAADADQLVLSAQKARQTLSGADPQLVVLHDEAVERYIGQHDRSNIVMRARVAILDQLPSGRVSEDTVARALYMTKRTLHRKLRDHGLSFRLLLVDVRQQLVSRYLADASLSLTEIAFMLGYSDASAFSRAFRRWFGKPPSAERAAPGDG